MVTMRGWANVALWVAVCFLAKISLHRPTFKPRLHAWHGYRQSLSQFAFSSLSDQWVNRTSFSFFIFRNSLLYKITISFTMVIKRSPVGESAGGGRSTSKSTCVVPAWTLTAVGNRPTSSLSNFSASVNSDLGNGSGEHGRTRREQGFTSRCCGELTCNYFRGIHTEAEKPKTEHVVVNSFWTRPVYRSYDYRSTQVTLNGYCSEVFQSICKPMLSLERRFFYSKRPCFAFVNRTRNGRKASARICRCIDFLVDRRLTPLCSVRGTAASFFSRLWKPRCYWKDLFLL